VFQLGAWGQQVPQKILSGHRRNNQEDFDMQAAGYTV